MIDELDIQIKKHKIGQAQKKKNTALSRDRKKILNHILAKASF